MIKSTKFSKVAYCSCYSQGCNLNAYTVRSAEE